MFWWALLILSLSPDTKYELGMQITGCENYVLRLSNCQQRILWLTDPWLSRGW